MVRFESQNLAGSGSIVSLGHVVPFVMLLLIIGAYAHDHSIPHAAMVVIFGALAFWMDKFRFSTIPVILGFIMGPIIESNLNRARVITQGDFMVLLSRPLTLFILALAVVTALAAYRRATKY